VVKEDELSSFECKPLLISSLTSFHNDRKNEKISVIANNRVCAGKFKEIDPKEL